MPSDNPVIRLQRHITRRISADIDSLLGPLPAELLRFRRAYRRATRTYRAISSRHELLDHLAQARIVLCGDYHALARAQRTAHDVIVDLCERDCSVTIGMEAIQSIYQDELNAYLAGKLDDEEFLDAVNWQGSWGFPFDHYRPIFDTARSRGLPVIALNTNARTAGRRNPSLTEREHFIARRIVAATDDAPGSLLFVLFGDLHLAPPHLPHRIAQVCGDSGAKDSMVIVYQNSERIYWNLARQGLVDSVDVVQVDDRSFCILQTPPWVKLQSYLEWLEQSHEVRDSDEETEAFETLQGVRDDELLDVATKLISFLGLKLTDVDDFELVTIDSLSRLKSMTRSYAGIPSVEKLIAHNNCLFFPTERLIFLALMDASHVAEGAARLVHGIASGHGDDHGHDANAFYRRTLRHSLGFFGSMMVNHRRKCWFFLDHELFVRKHRRRRVSATIRDQLRVSRSVLTHQRHEDRIISAGSGKLHLPAVYRTDHETGYAVSRAIGHIMGDKLYRGLNQGVVTREELARLFSTSFDGEDHARTAYLDVRRRLKSVVKRFTSKDQSF